jgi:hypothetical protein
MFSGLTVAKGFMQNPVDIPLKFKSNALNKYLSCEPNSDPNNFRWTIPLRYDIRD